MSSLLLGRYTTIEIIGQGGFGIVYKVQSGGVYYAAKVCTSFDVDSSKRFDREIRYIRNLDHPNIIKIVDFDLEYKSPYYVMELCDSQLKAIVSNGDIKFKIDIAIQICKGINFLQDLRNCS